MEDVTYSIVVPVYNEEESLPRLVEELRKVMNLLDGPAEAVLVDDGSRDRSYRLMLSASTADHRFKILQLSRNFGHQLALTAGLEFASGQAVVVLDADLQDPPQVILKMAEKWHEGYEVVNAVRERREGETFAKKVTARLYYRILRRLADTDQNSEVGDFRLVDRRALDAFLRMRETNRYVRGMFCWIGFRQVTVPYVRVSRQAGRSKYPLRKMLRLASDGVAGFSTAPLRLGIPAGLVLMVAGIGYGVLSITLELAGLHDLPGYAPLLATFLSLSGIQLIVVGVIGQYVGRVYDEVRGRPLYVVREAHGFAPRGAGGVNPCGGELAASRSPA